MKKRIVFDLDNTLIMLSKNYRFALDNVLKDLEIDTTDEEIDNYDNSLGLYELEYTNYNKKDFMEFTRKYFKSNIPDIFYDMLKDYINAAKYYEKSIEQDKEVVSMWNLGLIKELGKGMVSKVEKKVFILY